MGFFRNWFNNALKGGFKIGYSTGKPFDPRNAKHIHRDPIAEMVDRDLKKKEG